MTEGNSGTKTLNVPVTLSQASVQTVTVQYTTANWTATAGSDYVAKTGTLTFSPGQTTKSIPITINGDTVNEFDELFGVTFSNPTNATLSTTGALGGITNDDVPAVSAASASVTEGNSGTKTLNVPVTLSQASVQTVTVQYTTANWTATAGSDYVAKTGTLTFSPGQTTKSIPITINGDTVREPGELFGVDLLQPDQRNPHDHRRPRRHHQRRLTSDRELFIAGRALRGVARDHRPVARYAAKRATAALTN